MAAFTLLPKDGDVVSPCSSILIIIERRKCDDLSRVLVPHCPTTQSRGELEDATNQGHISLSRYRKHGRKQDLERSIEEFERALRVCPLDHPCRAAAQSNLAMAIFILCQNEDTDASLEGPLSLCRNALAIRPVGHVDRPSTLIQLAAMHFARFPKQREEAEQAQAEALLNEAIGLSSIESHDRRAAAFMLQLHAARMAGPVHADGRLSAENNPAAQFQDEDPWNLSDWLLYRFQRFGDLADLQGAITLLEELVRSASASNRRFVAGLASLGVALKYRFERFGELGDLEEAILRQRDAINLTPHGHPHKPGFLNNLGNAFRARFQRLGELSDLEGSISTHRDAVDLTPHGHPNKPGHLNDLGITLAVRFERFGELNDLEHAISRYRDAVDLAPRGHPDKPTYLSNLGITFRIRFERLGDLSDLKDAISRQRGAVDLTPHGHPGKPRYLTNLGNTFRIRFERLGELGDLEDALSMHRDAVDLTPHGHFAKPGRLSNLGNTFLVRFERFGELSDLEDAIARYRDAVDLTPHGHPGKPNYLNNLGATFIVRFERLGELSDLEDAISRNRDAVDLTPHGHPEKPIHLHNLGVTFVIRFRRLGDLSDLEDAISRQRDVVDLTPHGHRNKPGRLHNLGTALLNRFERLGELSDLEHAIATHRDAVDLTPHGHPDKPGLLNSLGSAFLARFQCLGELSDLEHAISRQRDAVDLTPDGHPNKPNHLNCLGTSFMHRFKRLRDPSNLEQAMFLYSRAASASTGPIRNRFQASLNWISCARHTCHHSLLHAYSAAITLLPALAWIGLSLSHRYDELSRGADVVREAAAAALDSDLPATAVEWLEQGRTIVWGELFQLRSSYKELSAAHPDHARKLQELSAALDHASATREQSLSARLEQTQSEAQRATKSLQQEVDRHRMLAIERDKLLQEIRGFPGFEKFLLHKEFSQLRASAHSGPIVILNAAESHCDALVILADLDHVIHVPLPTFAFQRSTGLQNMLEKLLGHARSIHSDDSDRKGDPATLRGVSWESLLSTLWSSVVKPVLDALAFSIPGDLSRIFWCPTGPFVFLPIHAAGVYGTQHLEPGHKVSDFVVSSYVPTLSILALSPNAAAAARHDLRLLAVGQPPSDGQSRLPGVDIELNRIRAVIRNSPAARISLLESSVGTVEEVLALMKEADWVHFACHGIQDPVNRTESGLCLANQRRLKLSDIIALSRPHGGLAFLSACQTAMGDERLSDEAIHVAAGMLFAGYGGAVGTMWSISDKLAPDVARDVYTQLFRNGTRPDYREAARALHDAIGRLRDRRNIPFHIWLPFIHCVSSCTWTDRRTR
ncbi:hypothetical protein OG21DRAFT_1274070 [Imleria badia]|nr:hypothetical protein OG21DRAFT_1274070 [Imleria badia]